MGDFLDSLENEIFIQPSDLVTVTKMNHLTEIQYMEKMNTSANIKKISKDSYVNLTTGEICDFNKTDNRSQGLNSLYQTFKKLRYLINGNFVGEKNELFVTLTYGGENRPNVGESSRISADFKSYHRKLQRRFGNVQFIRVLEPHADGHAHLHVLLRFDDHKSIYLSNSENAGFWGHGFVRVNRLSNIDNIGAYVSAYLTDLPISEAESLDSNSVVEKEGKKYVKGGRVKYYPTGKQIFNKSKGIKYPERKIMRYSEAKKIAGSNEPTYQKNVNIITENFENKIRYEGYNSLRV